MERPNGIVRFVEDHNMVTIAYDGTRTIGSKADALVWISKHIHTAISAEAVIAGIPIVMIDGSQVIFEEKH